jgi:hypothetical protein
MSFKRYFSVALLLCVIPLPLSSSFPFPLSSSFPFPLSSSFPFPLSSSFPLPLPSSFPFPLSPLPLFSQSPPLSPSPEARAVTYLAREVPRWRAEHPCYSCHNNGDAARALIAASRAGHDVAAPLADTLAWIGGPARWDANAQGGGFDDRRLARIQFAGALTSAVAARLAPADALAAAARIVAADQRSDGSWRLDAAQSVGAPATYGSALATWAARRTLAAAGGAVARPAIARADRWLRSLEANNIPDAGGVVLGLERAGDPDAVAQRARALALLRRGQAPDGGWGPYASSPSEAFDTSVALLALASLDDDRARPAFDAGARASAIARGRAFLVELQQDDGSWPETTRPTGQVSYAQRISTAGWATLALLETAPKR